MEDRYQEIDLMELIKVIIKKWWLFTGLCIIGVVIANYYSTNYTIPYYQAEATVFMGKEPSEKEEGLGISVSSAYQLTGQLANDYEQMLRSRDIGEKVIKKMNLDMTVDTLKNSLSLSPVDESRFVVVGFVHTDPQVAADVANELSKQLSEVAIQIIGFDNVSIVEEAIPSSYPVGSLTLMNQAVAGLIGIIIGLLIIILQVLMNNTIQKEEDIEKLYSLPVLAVIPMLKGVAK